jgi:hypothetical protein
MSVFPTTTPKSLLRWLSPTVLALAIVPAIASCGPTSGGGPGATAVASPTPATSDPATPSPTPAVHPGWTEVAHFMSADAPNFFSTLVMPPGWTYVPSGSSNTSDTLVGSPGELHMGGPTAMAPSETCSEYVQTNQGRPDLKLAGEEPITVGGVNTTEYWYTGVANGSSTTLFSIVVESDLTGCLGIEALSGSTLIDHQTIDRLFDSIVFHPTD